MMRIFAALIFVFASVPATSNAGPIVVGGGAGSGEFYLYYSLRIFPALINACAVSPVCSKNVEPALSEIESVRPYEKTFIKIVGNVELGSDLFRRSTDGVILVNQEKLFVERNGKLQPWSSRETIAFLLEIWSSNLEMGKNESALLAIRLADISELRRERTASSELDLVNFSLVKISNPVSSIAIEDNSGVPQAISLEIPLSEKLSCADSVGDVATTAAPMEALDIRSARWGVANRHQGENIILLQVFGLINYNCRIGDQVTNYSSRYRVEIRAVKTKEIYSIDPTQISVQQIEIVENPKLN